MNGLACDRTTKTCRSFPGEGQACENGFLCAEGLYCGHSRVCRTHPREGEPCGDDFMNPCALGLHCNSSDRCQADLPIGAACTDDDECLSGSCHPFDDVCREVGGPSCLP